MRGLVEATNEGAMATHDARGRALAIWREQSRSERERRRFLMRSALRHSAPRGRGTAHGAVPRGRVPTGDGGGHDGAGMRRAQKHMSRRGRRSK